MKDVLSFQRLERRTWYGFWATYLLLIIGPIIYCIVIEFMFSENGEVMNTKLIEAYYYIRFVIYFAVGLAYIVVFTAFFWFTYNYHYSEFKDNILYLSLYFIAIFGWQIVDIVMLY